eukprot:2502990-Amphidinium_carterae.1
MSKIWHRLMKPATTRGTPYTLAWKRVSNFNAMGNLLHSVLTSPHRNSTPSGVGVHPKPDAKLPAKMHKSFTPNYGSIFKKAFPNKRSVVYSVVMSEFIK